MPDSFQPTRDFQVLEEEIGSLLARALPARSRHNALGGDSVLNEGFTISPGKLFLDRGAGAYVIDEQGRRYVDFALGAGSMILGHAHPAVTDAVREQLSKGTLFVRPNHVAHDYADLLSGLQAKPKRFAFCNSGAEATMRAMRVARGFTGKSKIAVLPGSWHGSNDWGLFEEDYESPRNHPRLKPRSAGIPRGLSEYLALLPPDPDLASAFIAEHASDLAMVFAEPIRGTLPIPDGGSFLREMRRVTERHGVLLGLDETVTGFRAALGGAQELFGVDADIVTYGKIAGGGLPMGIVGTSFEIADRISANSPNANRIVYFGGTFSANPLACVAGLETINFLKKDSVQLYTTLHSSTEELARTLQNMFIAESVPLRAYYNSGIFRIIFTDRPLVSRRDRDDLELDRRVQDAFYNLLLLNGVHVGSNRIDFLSTMHGPTETECFMKAAVFATRRLRESGVFETR